MIDDDDTPPEDRARAAALASDCLDMLCDDHSHGNPDRGDVLRLALYAMRQVRESTGVNLFLRHDPETGVSFS